MYNFQVQIIKAEQIGIAVENCKREGEKELRGFSGVPVTRVTRYRRIGWMPNATVMVGLRWRMVIFFDYR